MLAVPTHRRRHGAVPGSTLVGLVAALALFACSDDSGGTTVEADADASSDASPGDVPSDDGPDANPDTAGDPGMDGHLDPGGTDDGAAEDAVDAADPGDPGGADADAAGDPGGTDAGDGMATDTGADVADASPDGVADTGPDGMADADSAAPSDTGEDASDVAVDAVDAVADAGPSCVPGEVCDGGTCNAAGDCVAALDGDTCPTAWLVGDLPWTDDGTTVGATPRYRISAGACDLPEGSGNLSEDRVYAFTPPATGMYRISVDASFVFSTYLVTDCAAIDSTCVFAADTGLLPLTQGADVTLEAGTVYWLVVDGATDYARYNGTYSVSFIAL